MHTWGSNYFYTCLWREGRAHLLLLLFTTHPFTWGRVSKKGWRKGGISSFAQWEEPGMEKAEEREKKGGLWDSHARPVYPTTDNIRLGEMGPLPLLDDSWRKPLNFLPDWIPRRRGSSGLSFNAMPHYWGLHTGLHSELGTSSFPANLSLCSLNKGCRDI